MKNKEYILKAKIDAKTFIEFLKPIQKLKNEVVFSINTNGLNCSFMDITNVSLLTSNLKPSSFTEYSINKDFDFCINTTNLYNLIKKEKGYIEIVINAESEFINNVVPEIYINVFGDITTKHIIKLIDFDTTEYKTQKEKQQNNLTQIQNNLKKPIEINYKTFNSILKQFSKLKSETLELRKTENLLKINSDNTTIEIPININDGELYTCKYSLEYLNTIVDLKLFENITIAFNTDYPIVITLKNDYISLDYIIAPRVNND